MRYPVVVWESGPSRIPGADSLDEAQASPLWRVRDLREALDAEYNSDAHLSPVVLFDDAGEHEEAQPRLNLSALHEALEHGYSPLLTAVFIDVDLEGHAPWSSAAEARDTTQAAHAALERAGLHAATYSTRAGWRAVIPVTPAVPLDKLPDLMGQPVEHGGVPAHGLLGDVQAALDAAGISGMEVDRSCRDRNRSYRAPRVMRDGSPTDPPFMDLSALDGVPLDIAARLSAATPAPRRESAADVDLHRPEPAPLSALAWAQLGIDGHLRRRMPGTSDTPSLAVAIRKQIPWFGAGERNVATHNAVTLVLDLIFSQSDKGAQEAANLTYWSLYPCLREAHLKGVSDTDLDESLDEMWGMIARHVGICVARREAKGIRQTQAEETRALVARALCDTDTQGESVGEIDSTPEGGQTFDVPAILDWRGSYYVLDARNSERLRYFPCSRNRAVVMKNLFMGCGSEQGGEGEGPLGLRLHNGEGKELALDTIYRAHGAQIDEVVVSHGRSQPRVNKATYTLERPGAVPIKAEPVYDTEVAGWLNLLGGDDNGALLDWLATCTRLDRPTCALYLQGPPGAGKSFFALCVSSLFGVGFVSFVEATSRFNGRLMQSPVVFLDEKAVTGQFSGDVSGLFRSLVANTEHRVEAKGKDTVTIRGACRVIIASNNASALPLVGQHSKDDMAAIASRILWLGMDERATEYLRKLGGREGTQDWIKEGQPFPGRFARHVRWLAKNREVKTGTRFLVEGKPREYHEGLALTEERLRILHGISVAVIQKGEGKGPRDLAIRLDGGDALVHSKSLRAAWYALTSERKTPSQLEFAGALKELPGVRTETGKGDHRGKSQYRVPGKYLLQAARRLGLSADALSKRLETGHKTARDNDTPNS